MSRKRIVVVAILVIAVVALWGRGTFDHALVNVGLNAKSCARNGFGATFCGQELDEYRERIGRVKREGEAAKQKIEHATRPEAPAETSPASGPPMGRVTLRRLPSSTQLEASITVSNSSCSGGSCDWFGQASQYPLSVGSCPAAFDRSHSIWTGPLQTTAGTIHQTVAFQPAGEGSLLICLYTHDAASGDRFVYGLREKVG